ncbi:Putative uncharacterized protein [Taphrina deformans PYCC 5710]|uniref:Uncharacterized protein n=1 Tax=Taphrina deformans (strain PYCC 5710 / ATCC 11124 / CBS 356.35 / IMI 108563 / JCM 9778 / NBRC 8474) TaxID=1097556 RepID=R4X7I3_TAPDE|nr:Putative uncharacterized protein [Taphrina deformans PYCC 5710]|eukprot:CCG81371.1 Putative uncharacterized protein [Taphrina deformans PYCC 5710]
MGANEQLVSLETMTPPGSFSRSPSPKKRRLSLEDTPEQTFVDARATPFAKRERRISDSSPVRVNKSTKTSNSSERNSAASRNTVNKDDSEDESSDDEAPEAISNANTAQTAKLSEAARREASQKQALEEREKRRAKDVKLRAQKEATKRATLPKESEQGVSEIAGEQSTVENVDESAGGIEDADEEDGNAKDIAKVKRQHLPRLLPDEILNAPQAPISLHGAGHESSSLLMPVKHTRFEIKKEVTTVKDGALTVQLLKRQRKDMAPKQTASVANTKNQWLYQRGQHSSNRRPIRKPLA